MLALQDLAGYRVGVGTDDALRHHVRRLLKRGVQQQTIAKAMGISQATLSRWLRQVPGSTPLSVAAMDGFYEYASDLSGFIVRLDTSMVSSPEPPAESGSRTHAPVIAASSGSSSARQDKPPTPAEIAAELLTRAMHLRIIANDLDRAAAAIKHPEVIRRQTAIDRAVLPRSTRQRGKHAR